MLIVFATLPIITRIYSPEDFGGWVIWFSVALIISSGAGLAYAQAIVLPKSILVSFSLLNMSILMSIFFGVATSSLAGFVTGFFLA